ncbi:hypothetical protein M501DRAFT_1060914 [Patellaria atrata CBS 101060]|uniref:Serine/threonine-protein kinase TEL1 n=1 Tax=Patellaria atrata CBS 101060 TaxID=1346257 RepID=A0A9P4S5H3_9PEZI|nr:hypothetical protein M501DRAFT_1060914 [Patellaria atrata CBS 101060]
MSEVNLLQAIENITSLRLRDRTEGLADLKRILEHNRRNTKLDEIKDETFHTIYESLFRFASIERAAYVKATKNPPRTQAASRLTACAATLRVAVDVGVRKLGAKTVKSLLDHIIETLPVAGENYCEPLSLGYVKCMSTILAYEPHVEHLLEKDWVNVVEFCIEGLRLHEEENDARQSLLSNGLSRDRTPSASADQTSRSGTRELSFRERQPADSTAILDELVLCLRYLMRASNAPISTRSEPILTPLIKFLQSSKTKNGRAHPDAVAAISSILKVSTLNAVEITHHALVDLIPLFKEMWSTKLPSLKDEILISLVLCKTHISKMMSSPDVGLFADHLRMLVESFHSDLSQRSERELLQIDDLRLQSKCEIFEGSTAPSTLAFELRNNRAESQWTIVNLIAEFSTFLDLRVIRDTSARSMDDGPAPPKRRHASILLWEYIRQMNDTHLSKRVCAFQIFSCMIQQRALDEEDAQKALEKISPHISDENGVVSSWAMLSATSCTLQHSTAASSFDSLWISLWNVASRNITTSISCRAACRFMDVAIRTNRVKFSSIADTVDGILSSIEINGPALLTDTTSSLWITILRMRSAERPSSFASMSERILTWLFSKWNPSNFDQWAYSKNLSQNCEPFVILGIISACMDRPCHPRASPIVQLAGPLGQAWQDVSNKHQVVEYLVLLEKSDSFIDHIGTITHDSALNSEGPRNSCENLVLEFLLTEIDKTNSKWIDWMAEKAQNVSSDMLKVVLTLCIVGAAIGKIAHDNPSRRAESVDRSAGILCKSLTRFIARSDCDQGKVDSVLELVSECLPNPSYLESLDPQIFAERGLLMLVSYLYSALEERKGRRDSILLDDGFDIMDMDDQFNSQRSQGRSIDGPDSPRHDYVARTEITSLRSSVTAYCHLISLTVQSLNENVESSILPPKFAGYLSSLTAPEFVGAGPFLSRILPSIQMSAGTLEELLNIMGVSFLELYEYSRSEVALGICLEIMSHSIPLWTDPDQRYLNELGLDIYKWFLKISVSRMLTSPNVQIKMVQLFHTLLRSNPDFGQDIALPSVRTSLFSILHNNEISVKHYIAEHIAGVFNLFILSMHEAIFNDVSDNLPSDPSWKEGIAIRILFLSRLASSWQTLLRRCVYYTFEVAAQVPGSNGHARRCLSNIAHTLGLPDSKSLLKLFAPQIIFTWLENNTVDTIPFDIFGYADLLTLMEEIEDELVGQIIMRKQEDQLTFVADLKKISKAKLVERCIAKSAAYSLSTDTVHYSKSLQSSESIINNIFGVDSYKKLIRSNFANVLGQMFLSTEQNGQLEKALAKKPNYAGIAEILMEMKTISSSDLVLPADQQPSFTEKYLLDRLERLCRRGSVHYSHLWTPDIYVYTLRLLIDRINTAMGSLHACSIIRKVRVLVALAGSIPHKGYPLQMTLRALRPFLTDSQCADDTLGIFQYLVDHGRVFLSSQLPFVAGIALSTLVPLRLFLGSSQDSTTQESQHIGTMSKGKSFYSWFGTYLEDYQMDPASDHKANANTLGLAAFKTMVRSASNITTEGNANEGAYEGKLLEALLDDQNSECSLLSESSRNLALTLLVQNFVGPSSNRIDMFGSDEIAIKYASDVWKSSQLAGVSDAYLVWTGKVLGRAFSSSGEVPWSLKNITHGPRANVSQMSISSEQSILQCLYDLLVSDNQRDAGLAEGTLRSILAKSSEIRNVTENIIPEFIVEALEMKLPINHSSTLHAENGTRSKFVGRGPDDYATWIKSLTMTLLASVSNDPILSSLSQIIANVYGIADKMFPFILHLVLLREFDGQQTVHRTISELCQIHFARNDGQESPFVQILTSAILYLRTRPFPNEATDADRDQWLTLDYLLAAKATARCNIQRAALLFAETYASAPPVRSSRRSSVSLSPTLPADLLLNIYKNIDEPDSFYGVEQEPSLGSVLDRLDFESDGLRSLLFRSARIDSQIRRAGRIEPTDSRGVINSLTILNLNGLTHSLLSSDSFRGAGTNTVESTLNVARKLEQWDIRAPEASLTESSTIFKAFQGLKSSSTRVAVNTHLDNALLQAMKFLDSSAKRSLSIQPPLRSLAVLSEIHDVLGSENSEHLQETWRTIQQRQNWMQAGHFEDVRPLLSSREILFSVLSSNNSLQEITRTGPKDLRKMEVQALLAASAIYRKHGALQESLASASYLSDLIPLCKDSGIDIEAISKNEIASVLWDQGEMTASVRMLQEINLGDKLVESDGGLGRSSILAQLARRMADARLEKPEEIMKRYLLPAINYLKDNEQGEEPGRVFHQFAAYCDAQLQNPDMIEELNRVAKLRDHQKADMDAYEEIARSPRNKQEKHIALRGVRTARKRYEMDRHDYDVLYRVRQNFLKQSLENYLLSLKASDEHDTDVMRVFALWLEYADMNLANDAMKKHLSSVPSRKFAALMIQLSSRLQAEKSEFQTLLSDLVFRICSDHPYHGMSYIYAGSSSSSENKDDSLMSRTRAVKDISIRLRNDRRAGRFWHSIQHANTHYKNLAFHKDDREYKPGRKMKMSKFEVSSEMISKIPSYKVPPATMSIELRADGDYSAVPIITSFVDEMSIANGLSQPKIVTAIASNGMSYKQLFKSGNDDMRQDAIMEQVFEESSKLLRSHPTTRQRSINIRTYKVLPLNSTSGIIEFVSSTIPIMVYLQPAHERYYPRDLKWNICRHKISEAATHSTEDRVKVYRAVEERFHPIMRYFFFERFKDPDEWFEKRLAYVRSTAAISMLGHVIGLGDRHCHNILLDEKSGEVVHIDLGVAFESGRLLPIPEVVPFRLTRDLVDGMGYARTEGVFRRCCEFTMDTLHEEKESIMTLLNVLRYDPLYNWSASPRKAKKMQEEREGRDDGHGVEEQLLKDSAKKQDETGEAGRALSVVEKKLSKTLSTAATVNDLIQQATDERNLALLYSGWGAYA